MGKVIKTIAIGAAAGALVVATGGSFAPAIFGGQLLPAVGLGGGIITPGLTALGAIGGAVAAGGLKALSALAKAFAPKVDLGTEAAGRTEEIRSATAPRTIVYGTVRLAGTLVYATTHGTDNKYLSMVFVVASHEIDGFQRWYLNDEPVTLDGAGFVASGRFAGKVRITSHVGTTTQAADTTLAAEVGEWTTAHQLNGLAYYVVRFEFDPEVFVNGRPRVNAVIRGAKLFDPRTSTTAWSDNWALVLRDYLTRGPLGCRIPAADIDDASFIAAANIADELVTLRDSTTQKRYTADGVVNVTRPRESVIRDILSAGAGQLIYQGGRFRLYPGAAVDAITVTLDESDLRGPLTVQARRPRRELVNRVRGQYIDARSDLYQAADYPAVTNAAYEAQDGGDVLELDLDLPFTTEGRRAQRIAKIALEDARRQMTVQFPAKLKGLQVQAWSVVRVTNARFGWSAKEFRVVGWQLSADGGVDLVLREYDANIYAWNATTDEQALAAPAAPTLQDGTQAPDVTGLSVAPLTFAQGGAKVPGLQATWTAPEKVVTATEVQFKRSSDPDWKPGPPVIDPQNPRVLLSGVLPDESIDVRVRHKTGFGKFGVWATSSANTLPADSFIATDVLTGAGKAVAEPGADVTANNTAADTVAVNGKAAAAVQGETDDWLKDRLQGSLILLTSDPTSLTWMRLFGAVGGNAGRKSFRVILHAAGGGSNPGELDLDVFSSYATNHDQIVLRSGIAPGNLSAVRLVHDVAAGTMYFEAQVRANAAGQWTLQYDVTPQRSFGNALTAINDKTPPAPTGKITTLDLSGNQVAGAAVNTGSGSALAGQFCWRRTGQLDIGGNKTLTSGGNLSDLVRQDQGNGVFRNVARGLSAFLVRDQVGVTFPQAYQSIPKVFFIPGGLTQSASLTGDQAQDFVADQLSTGGFTPKLKVKQLASGITTVTETSGFAGGQPSGPAWQGDKVDVSPAFDSTYKFNVNVTVLSSGGAEPEPGFITLGFWTNSGSGWVMRATQTFSLSGTYTVSVIDGALSVHSGKEFGVSVEAVDANGSSLDSFNNVKYDKATAPPEVTATPSGVADVVALVLDGAET